MIKNIAIGVFFVLWAAGILVRELALRKADRLAAENAALKQQAQAYQRNGYAAGLIGFKFCAEQGASMETLITLRAALDKMFPNIQGDVLIQFDQKAEDSSF